MIKLYMPPGTPWGLPNLSPFGTKLATYLRIAGWPYETRPADFRRAPKGKIPYVQLDGKLLGDSQLIIEELERRRGGSMDTALTANQRATGHAVQRMLDEAFYFVLVHNRWADDAGWDLYRPVIGAIMPAPVRLILPLVRRSVRKSLITQGHGRHSEAEIMALGIKDMNALAAIIGDNNYLLGDVPSTYDASAFAAVHGLLAFPLDSPLRRFVQESKILLGYRDRVWQKWFPELVNA